MLIRPPIIRRRYGIRLGPVAYQHVQSIHGVNGRPGFHSDILRLAYQCQVEFIHDHGLGTRVKFQNPR